MSAPVKNTCPDIDAVIEHIRNAEKAARQGYESNERDSDDEKLFWEILSELKGLDREMDKLRADNAALRGWGDMLNSQLEDAAALIHDLQAEVIELR